MNQKLPASGMRISSPALALMILAASFAFLLILVPVITGLLGKTGMKYEALVRISMVIQDVFVFILPALPAALLATRLPAKLLAVDRAPGVIVTVLSILALLVSMPAMNLVVEWNNNLHLPESMAAIESQLRNMEDAAANTINTLMEGAGIGSLVVSILIIGVLAGFSEELFFRGAMQRIIMCTKVNGHVAVWLVAIIFSMLHFQFFGFVPRVLLGAYFGYLLWWSRSLWLPIFVHVFNNSVVVYNTWRTANAPGDTLDIDKIGTDLTTWSGIITVAVSLVLTVAVMTMLYRTCKAKR